MSDDAKKSTAQLLGEAVAAMRDQQHDHAIALADQILEHAPDNAQASAIKFNSQFKSRRFEAARKTGQRAAELNPQSEFILHNLACLQLDAGQPKEAIQLLNSLIHEFGERPAWLFNLGLAYNLQNDHGKAIDYFQRTLDIKPDHDKAMFQLCAGLRATGQRDHAVELHNFLRVLRSNHSPSHSDYLHNVTAISGLSLQELKQEMNLWGRRFIPREGEYPSEPIKYAKRVKFGFLLGDLPATWLAASIGPVINELAKGDDTVYVYHRLQDGEPVFSDDVHTRQVAELSDTEFALQVRKDRIEILVDVCGMRAGERQRALGLRVAPNQFGWFAHEGVYASSKVTPIDEQLGQWPFFINLHDAPTADKPLPDNHVAALGCERGIANLVVRTWSEIPFRFPDHTLHFAGTFEDAVISTISKQFESFGVDPGRLSFGNQYHFNNESIAIENFLENDVVAVAHALSAGASIIALRGSLFPAQQTANLLGQLERDDWITSDRINYIGKILRMIRKHKVRPLSEAELENSNLQDLQWFSRRLREKLLDQSTDVEE